MDFTLDEKNDIIKYSSFERIFRVPVWFVFSNKNFAYRKWYWIRLTGVIEKAPVRTSSKGKKDQFRAINIKDCITVGWEDGLQRIFNF